MSLHHLLETTFTFRVRVATHTALGGVYLRDIDLPVSFEEGAAYHEIILDFLATEGVPQFQIERLNAEHLQYTCPTTRVQNLPVKNMPDVPDNAVLYYSDFAPAEARSLALPPFVSASSTRCMLVTRDPVNLHVYFSGHRMTMAFPVAQSDFHIVKEAVESLGNLGVSYIEDPIVAMVKRDNDQLSPRLAYNGREALHTHCLELIGQWEAIPRRMDTAPMPPSLDVRCAPRDALVPRPA